MGVHASRGSVLVIDLAHPDADGDATAAWEAAAARRRRRARHPPGEGGTGDGAPIAPSFRCRADGALLLARGPHPVLTTERERVRGRPVEETGDRAGREWALSIEALEHFVCGEPVARVHACVFAALALKLGSSG